MKGNIQNLKFLFTTLVVVYPILSVYYSGFSSLTVADFFLLILLIPILFLYYRWKKIKIRKSWIFFFLFLFVQFFVLNLYGIDDYGIMRIFRYLLYYFVIAVISLDFFDIGYGYKVLRNTSLFVSIFGIVQAIGIYIFGFYISGVLEFLPIMREELLTYGDNYVSGVLRVRSVFGEPAHLAAYLSVYLIICLHNEKSRNIKDALIVTLCLVFSVASTAYYMLLFIWGIFLIKTIIKSKETSVNKVIWGIIFSFIGVGGIFLLLKTELWEKFWNRNFVIGDSITGRFSGYKVFDDIYSLDGVYKLWGHGYSDYGMYVDSFLASIPLMYWYMGYIGLGTFVIMLIWELIKQKEFVSKILILAVGILGLATQIFVSYNLILYMIFAIIISDEAKKELPKNEGIY